VSPTPALAPWQIWLVDFGQPIGHEQGGLRPAVVVGSAAHCRFPIDMALVVPLTTRDRGLDHHVRIDSSESGLNRPSWARTEEIMAVSTKRFARSKPLGGASAAEIAKLREWLRVMVAI
jgi:mRNA interferase MazF